MPAVSDAIRERLERLGLVPCGPLIWGGRWKGEGLPGGGTLRLGLAEPHGAVESRWIGRSLWWFPEAARTGRPWYAVVNSRVGRHPERRPGWFPLLEQAIAEAGRAGATVVVVEGTAAAEWVAHVCALFRVPCVGVRAAPESMSLEEWLGRIGRGAGPAGAAVDVSPPLEHGREMRASCGTGEACGTGDRVLTAAPRRDRLVVGLADRLFALHVRDGGNLHSLLRERMRVDAEHPRRLRVAVLRRGGKAARRLIAAGAVGWFVAEAADEVAEEPVKAEGAGRAAEILSLDELLERHGAGGGTEAWPFLVHCTRAPEGPWPDQTVRQYRDALTLAGGALCRGPLDALERILRQGVLWDSARLVRGDLGVVCWSAVPLGEYLRRRTFRAHLGRWDYEPYGVGVRRATLVRHGARPVRYGPPEEGRRLAADQRPFFQPSGERVDWTREREWRVAGPVRLTKIPAADAFVFVPSRDAARRIAPLSRWPVVLVPE